VAESHTIAQFVRQLRGRHRWWSIALAAFGHALVCAVVLCLADLLAPSAVAWLGLGAVVWLLGVCGWTWLRLGSPLPEADRELGLSDRLLTYLGMRRGPGRPGFASWLERDLERRIEAIPPATAASVWRRPLGKLRYLLPLLLLLLLLREFAPFPSRPDDHGPDLASGPGGGGGGPSPAPGQTQPRDDPAFEPPPPQPSPTPPQEPPVPPPPGGEEQELIAPPPPEFEADVVERFVIPQFVGEGETRKHLSRLALVGQAGGGGQRPGVAEPAERPSPPADLDEYERAHERALRSRHVPAAERAFVKAYFDALLEAVR